MKFLLCLGLVFSFIFNAHSNLSPEIIDKNLVRIKTLLPKMRVVIIYGSQVYEKAIKEVSADNAIDADLYEQINQTTSYILGIEKVLGDIESEVKEAHTYFNATKNVSSLKPGSDKISLQSELDSSSTNKGMILFIIIPLFFT